MQDLIEGLIHFRKQNFQEHKSLFCKLERCQRPHTLFITCSDSRVVPELITNSVPGELFVVRNIANLVPPYCETKEHVATTSAIEYAINVLEVQNIVVCGHSNCGGCASIHLSDDVPHKIPHTKKWLELTHNVKKRVSEELKDNDDQVKEWLTEQINVIEQIKNLSTYPFIEEKYNNNEINIHGWYYVIETGEVLIYNDEKKEFELAN